MDWGAVFSDIQKWMIESNEVSKRFPISSDQYWEWVVQSTGTIGNKYNNHPLVSKFLIALISFQEENYKRIAGRNS
ncbi:hypothetical protein [Enterococcus italicus]|uniref:hypothetical protein n=1 Tax=Enterococcus italicus TaxID=246144 RepID=UPI0028B0E0CC|nr:hypothetical protein [Enterococcus italicus]